MTGRLSPAGVDRIYRRMEVQHTLTSRKLTAALGGMVTLIILAGFHAWQGIGDFPLVVGATSGITSIAILGQAYLDARGNG